MTGTVVKVMGKFYTVAKNGNFYNCSLRGKMRSFPDAERFSNPVAVGDFVDFEWEDDGSGLINKVFERKNVFSRRDKGRRKEDIIAANLDLVVILQAFDYPPVNFRFADRVLVRAAGEEIPAVLCINKSDLANDDDRKRVNDYYKNSGVELFFFSAINASGLESFRSLIRGRRSILAGTSGAGKSTLINALDPGLELRTGEVSDSTRKGRHTTTNVEMITLEDNTSIIDTPGMKAFGLMDIHPEELGMVFHEFNDYASECLFSPCTHDHEPGCGVKVRLEDGIISEERYISYLNILNSLIEYNNTRYK